MANTNVLYNGREYVIQLILSLSALNDYTTTVTEARYRENKEEEINILTPK